MRANPLLAGLATLVLLPLVAGCGGGKDVAVRGKVTLNGSPLEQGYITLYPEDGHGTAVGGPVNKGEYHLDNVAPGKKRVQVQLTEQGPSSGANPGRSRTDANEQRLKGLKNKGRRPSTPSQPQGAVSGNNRIVEVTGSMDDLNIELTRGGKAR